MYASIVLGVVMVVAYILDFDRGGEYEELASKETKPEVNLNKAIRGERFEDNGK